MAQIPNELLNSQSNIDLENISENMTNEEMQLYLNSIKSDNSHNSNSTKKNDLSQLFIIPDSLAHPISDSTAKDSLFRNKQFEIQAKEDSLNSNLRYSQRIFKNINPNIFSSTTNRVNANYPLKAGDKLILNIWGEVEKEETLMINNNGQVFIPNVGMIPLNGATLTEAEETIKKKLKRKYSGFKRNKTFMSLIISNLSPLKIFVLGEVRKPGAYVFHGNTSILQALYYANGPTDIGSVRYIQITRDDSTMFVDLYKYLIEGKTPEPSILLDGDIIFLPRAKKIVQLLGAVGREGKYELRDSSGIKELLLAGGKVDPNVANNTITITRFMENGSQDIIDADTPLNYINEKSTFELEDGDIVLVRASSEIGKNNLNIKGAIKYPGSYQFTSSITSKQLIKKAGGLTDDSYNGRIQIVRPHIDGTSELLSQSLDDGVDIELMPSDTILVYSKRDMTTLDTVSISGAVFKPGKYVFFEGMSAKDLILLAGGFLPNRQKGKIRLDQQQKNGKDVEVSYISISDNYDNTDKPIILSALDHLEVPFEPNYETPKKVKLSGAFKFPGTYVLKNANENIKSLISRAGGLKQEAYASGTKFFREFKVEKHIANDTFFVNKLEQIGLDMNQALENNKLHNIGLQDGDSIYVPIKWASIKISGEIAYPSNVLYKKGEDVWYYVANAGGLKITSDKKRIFVKYADGSVTTLKAMKRDPDPGSEIIIPYKEPKAAVDVTKLISSIVAITSALVTTTLSILIFQNTKGTSTD